MTTRTVPMVPRDRLVVGEPADVANVLLAAHRRGALVDRTRAVHLADGRVEVKVRLLEPARVITGWPRFRHPRLLAAGAVLALGLLAAVAYGLVIAAQWVLAHLPHLLGGLVVVGVIATAITRSGVACRGLHCPGCPHT